MLGRADHLQAKIGGARVDLQAVERLLAAQPGVAAAPARAWPHPLRPQDSVLAAYVVAIGAEGPRPETGTSAAAYAVAAGAAGPRQEPAAGAAAPGREPGAAQTAAGAAAGAEEHPLVARLRRAAAGALPAAARPSVYVLLDRLPRSPAGKVLRSQLPPPPGVAAAESVGEAAEAGLTEPQQQRQRQQQEEEQHPQSSPPAAPPPPPTESRVVSAFAAALGPAPVAQLEATSDFFAQCGGDSLAAAAAANILGIDVRMLFTYPSARGLAAALRMEWEQRWARQPAGASPGAGAGAADGGGGGAGGGATAKAGAAARGGRAAVAEAGGSSAGLVPAAKRRRIVLDVSPAAAAAEGAPGAAEVAAPVEEGGGGGGPLQQWLQRAAAATIHSSAGRALRAAPPRGAAAAPGAGAAQAYRAFTVPAAVSWRVSELSAGTPPAAAPAAGAAAAEGAREGACKLEVLWRRPLGLCVDAAPELVSLELPEPPQPPSPPGAAAGAPAGSGDAGHGAAARLVALACSHGGGAAAFDVATGVPLWGARLPGRADAGLAAEPGLREVAVACSGGRLCCLDLASGDLVRTVDCGGELRAAPAADPWPACGRWWAATHGRELLVVRPGGGEVLR